MSDPTQQYIPPDPRQEAVQRAALKYQRAAQVAADAAYIFYIRLFNRVSLHEFAVPLTAAAVPAIIEAIMADEEILDPHGEE